MPRFAILLCLCATLAPAQELAHRGWQGNRIAPEAWYRHATFVRFSSDTTYEAATKQLENLNSVGADTLILPDPEPAPNAALPFADHYGTEEQLDALLREASARRMHVLITAPAIRLAANPGELRFWMNRGIAGFDIGTITPVEVDSQHILATALSRFPGERILVEQLNGFPGKTIPTAHASPCTVLDEAVTDWIGGQPKGFTAHMYVNEYVSTRYTPSALIPILESADISNAELQPLIRLWLSLRHYKGWPGTVPLDGSAKPLDLDAPPSGARHHRR